MPTREFVIYVIELTDEIKNKAGFMIANPMGSKCCLYVGSTAKSAEERFRDHAEGLPTGSSYIRGFVKHLRHELAPKSRFLSRENAELGEKKHAARLRRRGYFVWQK
jgi:hypothetical protein